MFFSANHVYCLKDAYGSWMGRPKEFHLFAFILRTMFKYLFNKLAAIWWPKFPSRTQNVWMKRFFCMVSIWYAVLFYFIFIVFIWRLSLSLACCLEQINRNAYRVYSSTILENAVHSSDCVLTIFMCSLFHGSLLVFNIIFLLLFFLFRNSQSISDSQFCFMFQF